MAFNEEGCAATPPRHPRWRGAATIADIEPGKVLVRVNLALGIIFRVPIEGVEEEAGVVLLDGMTWDLEDLGLVPDANGRWDMSRFSIIDTLENRMELATFLRQLKGGLFTDWVADELDHLK